MREMSAPVRRRLWPWSRNGAGFVKQSGGHVRIYSEEGHGTAVKIYLPRLTKQESTAVPTSKAIESSKTPKSKPSEVVLVVEDNNGSRLRPISALKDWLEAAGISEGALFRPIRKGGKAVEAERLSDRSVADIVKAHAKAIGLDQAVFSGHSLRSGFVTSALQSGADVLRVMDVTRHRQINTLKVYDRRAKAFKQHAGEAFL